MMETEDKKKIGQILIDMRGSMSREDVAGFTHLSVKTIQNAEDGRTSPTLETLTRMLTVYQPPIEQILTLLQMEEIMYKDAAYDPSQEHFKLLEVFEKVSYICHFISNTKGDSKLETLEIENLQKNSQGYLYAKAITHGYDYDCKVTCNRAGTYAFLSFTSHGRLADRAFFILPYDRTIKKQFNIGLGVMLSLANPIEDKQYPCFQMVSIVNSEYTQKIGVEKIEEIVRDKLKFHIDQNEYRVCVSDISTKSNQLFMEIESLLNEIEED